MIVTVRDPNILKTLEPNKFGTYLQQNGWKKQSHNDHKSSIWTCKNEVGEEYEILLPLEPEMSGFSLRMFEVIQTLEIVENRSQIKILADLLTSLPNTTLQGVVMQIYTPNSDKLSGEIALFGIIVDQLRKIQTELADYDYILAIKAYQERLPIVCTGDLIKENNHFILKNPHNFNLDQTWQN